MYYSFSARKVVAAKLRRLFYGVCVGGRGGGVLGVGVKKRPWCIQNIQRGVGKDLHSPLLYELHSN